MGLAEDFDIWEAKFCLLCNETMHMGSLHGGRLRVHLNSLGERNWYTRHPLPPPPEVPWVPVLPGYLSEVFGAKVCLLVTQ